MKQNAGDAPLHILLVDDETDILAAIAACFEKQGCQCTTADSGKDAAVHLRSNRIDAIVTDLYMPRGDGFELLATVQKECPSIPIFIMSGYSTAEDGDLKKRGAKALLKKPFNPELMLAAVLPVAQAYRNSKEDTGSK